MRVELVADVLFDGKRLPPRDQPAPEHEHGSHDAAVRGHRLFERSELDGIALHPPIARFLSRWQPGDPVAYLGALWAR